MSILGRVLYALPLAVFGALHFMSANMMAGMVPAYVPGGVIWVYVTGAALILAAIAILFNRMVGLAGLLLGIMLLSFVLTIHLPGLSNPDTAMMSMPNVLKDTALAGAAFAMAAFAMRDGKGLFAM